MPNDDPTLPPLGARTPRNIGKWLLAWAKANPVAATGIACLLAGIILGAVIL